MTESPVHVMLRQHMPGMPERDVDRFAASVTVDEPYCAPPVDDAVPVGALETPRHRSARIFPSVERSYIAYAPRPYDDAGEAALMVFQDGARYLGPEANTARVFDDLIACGAIAPSVRAATAPSMRPGNGPTPPGG